MIFIAPSREEREYEGASQGFVYSFAGFNKNCYRYSVETNTWSRLASIPQNPSGNYWSFSIVALGEDSRYIFVIHKEYAGIYDTYADKWNSLLILNQDKELECKC